MTILVVDDDKDTLEVLTEYLRTKLDDEFLEASSAKQAIDLYKDNEIEMTIIDAIMPDYDGFYTLKRIRKLNPKAKIIMATGDLTSDMESNIKKHKANGIILKPYEIDTVIDEIVKVSKEMN